MDLKNKLELLLSKMSSNEVAKEKSCDGMNTDTTYINKKNDEVEYLVDNSYSSESDNDVGGKETSNIITIKDATDDEDMDDFNSDQSEDDPNFVGQKYDKFIADEDLSMSDSTPASPFLKDKYI